MAGTTPIPITANDETANKDAGHSTSFLSSMMGRTLSTGNSSKVRGSSKERPEVTPHQEPGARTVSGEKPKSRSFLDQLLHPSSHHDSTLATHPESSAASSRSSDAGSADATVANGISSVKIEDEPVVVEEDPASLAKAKEEIAKMKKQVLAHKNEIRAMRVRHDREVEKLVIEQQHSFKALEVLEDENRKLKALNAVYEKQAR